MSATSQKFFKTNEKPESRLSIANLPFLTTYCYPNKLLALHFNSSYSNKFRDASVNSVFPVEVPLLFSGRGNYQRGADRLKDSSKLLKFISANLGDKDSDKNRKSKSKKQNITDEQRKIQKLEAKLKKLRTRKISETESSTDSESD